LLQRLEDAPDRSAHFVSTLVAVRHAQDPQPLVAMGRWPGHILQAPRGNQGFGYDPLMFIPALDCTVAEMDAALKNRHSHRARAMAQMRVLLREVWRV
jgi:XTP/dITP diphosphohydrolase